MVTGFLVNRRADNLKDLVEELLPLYEKLGCNIPWISTFWVLIWTSFRRTVVLCVTSTVKVSTRTLQQWRADTKGNGAHQCFLIIAGLWCVIFQVRLPIGRWRRSDCIKAISNLDLWRSKIRDDSSKTVVNEAILFWFSCSEPQFT
jgi:hypothetical protein